MTQTGFIGLGAMGAHMARNLHRAGLLAGVWNRTADKAMALSAQTGVPVAADPAALAASTEVIVTCVSADGDLLDVVHALLPSARPGFTLVDCSTVSAGCARQCAALLAARGAGFADAPVSGGVEGARLGTLAIMVGAGEADFARVEPVLRAMGKTVTHLGAVGCGQATKATNQIMCAGIIQAVAEAMAFARAEGLPLAQVIEALGQGAGSSWYFVHRAPFMAKEDYPAGFRVALHAKDLRICRDMAARHGASLPVVDTTLALYAELMATGHGDEDISTVFRLKKALFDGPSAAPERTP